MKRYSSVNEAIDSSGLARKYWVFGFVVAATTMFEYFDLYLIGYVLSVVGPAWGLTFGQSSLVLVASGAGAIIGAVIAGWAGDRFGRKPTMLATLVICSLATGGMALVPEGSWQGLALLRLIIGASVPALHLAAITLVVELTPTQRRTTLSSLLAIAFVPMGGMVAALCAMSSDAIGWRGLVLFGLIGLTIVPLISLFVPESPRWLLERGRSRKAEAELRWITGDSDLTLATSDTSQAPKAHISELFSDYRKLILLTLTWFGVSTVSYALVLWGPTMMRLLLDLTPGHAARLFILVSLGGLVGRIATSFMAGRLGRRTTGITLAFAAAISCVIAAYFKQVEVAGFALFLPVLAITFMFADGAWANVGPMSAELYPTALRSRAGAYTQIVNGLGKIIGPMILAIVAGTGNLVSPQATVSAITPVFFILAAFSAIVGITFLLVQRETHGRSLERLAAGDPERAAISPSATIKT